MSDDAIIRLVNLKRLNQTPKDLEQRVGGRYTYWRDLLAGNKSFGEKAARKIEAAYGLVRGALDQVDGLEERAPTAAKTSKPGTISPEVALLSRWLDGISDPVIKESVLQACMQLVLEARQKASHPPTLDTDPAVSPEKQAASHQQKT